MQEPCGDSRPRLSGGAKLRYGAQRGEAVDVGKKPEACTNYVGTAAPGCPAEQSSAEFMVVVNKLGGPAATKKKSDFQSGNLSAGGNWRATLARTAGGGCPHMAIPKSGMLLLG